ncbi:uncharacterized protein ACNLHF_025173 [Anomaloglossus baeobatrachus]|uniref:uncharacterized protein LOC142246473 n=1 Tax=Anomaloglossus baeobatrachus TaxID=238106 RepID=UPI003F4FC467
MAQQPEGLLERVHQFTPGNVPGYQRVSLQLFGMLGHGKSSLVNSCVCVVKNEEYHNVAGAGTSQGGLTIRRHEHELTEALVIVDNRGFTKLATEEILEACAQLRSLRDIGEVTWEKDNLEVTLERLPHKYTDRPADFILPVLVFRGNYILTEENSCDFEKLITNSFRITGVHPIVVITNCNVNNREEMKNKFGKLGVTKKICLENYTENNCERTEEKDQRILEFLNMCIQEAERGLRMRRTEDRQERFVTQATEQIKLESTFLKEEVQKLSSKKPGDKSSCTVS